MPPKGKKTKAEEALDFLSNLDNLDAPPPPSTSPGPTATGGSEIPIAPASAVPSSTAAADPPTRSSTDSTRSKRLDASTELGRSSGDNNASSAREDEEAQKALAFLEAQINTKRAPLSVPGSTAPRGTGAVLTAPTGPTGKAAEKAQSQAQGQQVPSSPANQPSQQSAGGGWGGGWWGAATSAIQSAQKMADEGYKKVRAEGAQGLEGLGVKGLVEDRLKNLDLEGLRKGAEQRLAEISKNVDLEKLRNDLVSTTQSTLTTLLNTVAPPISAHETLELWLTHPMIGYSGVEGVIYRAWMRILEQTESGEMIVVWSPPDEEELPSERGMYPVNGWEVGWKKAREGLEAVKKREEKNPKGRGSENATNPVTTIPIFLHLQPILAPLSIPEPSILTNTTSPEGWTPPNHFYFLMVLSDPKHSIQFTTISQPSPADWLEVPYENSDWVEERLVDVIQTGVEVVAQDYVATRMGLKGSGITRPATPAPSKEVTTEVAKATAEASPADKKDTKKD